MNTADVLAIFDELLARKLPTERHSHFEPVRSGFDPYGLGGRDEERKVTTEELSWSGAAQWVLEADVAMKSAFPPSHALRIRWDSVSAVAEGKSWQLGEESMVRTTRAVLEAARKLIRDGRLQSVIDGVRAETVVELLDRAAELLDEGAPLPAVVVLVGGALETHLRHLCERADPARIDPVWTKSGSIDAYKAALDRARKAGTTHVSLGDTKQITAWGDRRNAAAHTPLAFTLPKEEVRTMIEHVGQFIDRTSKT